ncbi:hypothetical protein Tco_1088692 [Tanacetum coccineum]
MMKFPTLKGIATLVTRSVIISECRRLEKKQVIEEEKKEEVEARAINVTDEVLVNPAFLDQLVVIGGGLPETYKYQLKLLLKDNMDIFAWEPTDMTGVPRRIIEHNLNVNTSIELERQKRRVLALEKSEAVAKDVNEWVRAACPKDFYPLPHIDCKACSFMLCDLDFEPLSLSLSSLPSCDLVSFTNILILCLILKASNQSLRKSLSLNLELS